MPPTTPLSPRILRGAIVGFDLFNPLAAVCVFQYNPDTVQRALQPRSAGEGGAKGEATRVTGAPIETLRLEVTIDAADQLEQRDPIAGALGIYPQLSALEMLVYPKTAAVIANTVKLAAGALEVIPTEAPLTLLVWGLKRVVPVRVSELSIDEQFYDPSLNPQRATVSLGLRVLTYSDLPVNSVGYWTFVTHQAVKEAFAVIGSVSGTIEAGRRMS